MLRTTAILITFALVGCYETSAPECTISCTVDDECPGDLGCNGGACSTGMDCSGPPISDCTANEFLSCTNASTARLCNATGDGAVTQDCGAPGCNETAERCNTCAPSATSCADANTLQQCNPDGAGFAPGASCQLGCADATGPVSAHCRTIQPLHLPDICDTPAVNPVFAWSTSGTLDTNVATSCDQVITQASGPAVCVIRAGTISVSATLTAAPGGISRILALVADGALDVTGTIDVAAEGTSNGPGGGQLRSGDAVSGSSGGGGAGFKTTGAAGGSTAGAGQGGNGGAILNPLLLNHMNGGTRPNSGVAILVAVGGGGGGGLMLVSCKGTVTVSGLIDAGGGGGGGGRDIVAGAQLNISAAGGGGAGGYVVMQGGQVVVTSTAQLYANGGGGGGGTNTNDTTGGAGGDGPRSTTTAAAGGTPLGAGAGAGGNGGRVGAAPGVGGGTSVSSGGGGGGSTGMFQVYTPAGVTPMLAPMATSPAFESSRIVMTR